MDDEKLRTWLDECDEWVEATDIGDREAVPFLRARLKRAVLELRERIN